MIFFDSLRVEVKELLDLLVVDIAKVHNEAVEEVPVGTTMQIEEDFMYVGYRLLHQVEGLVLPTLVGTVHVLNHDSSLAIEILT